MNMSRLNGMGTTIFQHGRLTGSETAEIIVDAISEEKEALNKLDECKANTPYPNTHTHTPQTQS